MISEKLLPALVAVLVASAAGNALLGWAWLSARDDAATAAAELSSMTEPSFLSKRPRSVEVLKCLASKVTKVCVGSIA